MTYESAKSIRICSNPYCLDEFSGQAHASFCSTACRVQFNRIKKWSDEDKSIMRADTIRYLRDYADLYKAAITDAARKVSTL